MTPDRWLIMRRAAARVVMNIVRTAVTTGASKSASDISASGVPCTSPWLITLNEMSRLGRDPAWASTASTTVSAPRTHRPASHKIGSPGVSSAPSSVSTEASISRRTAP